MSNMLVPTPCDSANLGPRLGLGPIYAADLCHRDLHPQVTISPADEGLGTKVRPSEMQLFVQVDDQGPADIL